MKNMTPEQREAAAAWRIGQIELLKVKRLLNAASEGQDKLRKVAYTLDTDCHPPLLEAPPK